MFLFWVGVACVDFVHCCTAAPVAVFFAQSLRLRSEEQHVQHARWIQEEMPVRLAHRLSDFLELPFVIVCNARFHEVHREKEGAR